MSAELREARGGIGRLAAPLLAGPTRLFDTFMERRGRPGQARMGWWESRVWLAADPALFALLRSTGRVGVVPLGPFGTLVNDLALGRAILQDAERFQAVGPGTHGALMNAVLGPNALLNTDGPTHEAMRHALNDLFAAGPAVRIAADASGGLLADAVARLRAGGEVDVARLVRVMAGRAVLLALGVPEPKDGEEGYLHAYAIGEELLAMMTDAARRGTRAGQLRRASVLVAELRERARPGWEADVDAVLPRLRAAGFDQETALSVAVTVLVAGTETLGSGLPRSIAVLIDSGQWQRLRPDDVPLLDRAIDNCLRLVTPTAVIVRSCVEPVDVHGRRFRAGERVLISVYGMTRTRALAPGRDPELMRIVLPVDRELRHLSFGAGSHFCIGSALARAEMRAVLTALHGVGPLAIVRRRPARGVLFPSYRELVVRVA
jgi:cytochrome P450